MSAFDYSGKKYTLIQNLFLSFVSLVLAIALWIGVLAFKNEEMKKNVKLEPLLAPGMMIINKLPSYIQFTVSGPRLLLEKVRRVDMPLRPDLRSQREKTVVITVTEDMIGELPRGVRVVGFFPTNIVAQLDEVVERFVSVRPTLVGTLPDGLALMSYETYPARVAVAGPKSLFSSLEWVGTEAIELGQIHETVEVIVSIEVDTEQGFRLSRESAVKVRLRVKAQK